MAGEVKVVGLKEFQRACKKADKSVQKGVRKTLKKVGEPVRQEAQDLAVARIRNIGTRWPRMRTGVTAKTIYVVPSSRRAGGSPRPSLKGTLLGRSMIPALENKEIETFEAFERWMDEIVDAF